MNILINLVNILKRTEAVMRDGIFKTSSYIKQNRKKTIQIKKTKQLPLIL